MRLKVLNSVRRLFSPDPGSSPGFCPVTAPAGLAENKAAAETSDGSVQNRLEAAIEEVRPAIRMDGGDIDLVGFREGTVTVRFKGACRSCPMAEMTLQLGVERVLKQLVPEVQRVEAV